MPPLVILPPCTYIFYEHVLTCSPATLRSDANNFLLERHQGGLDEGVAFMRHAESAPGQFALVTSKFSTSCCWRQQLELQKNLLRGSLQDQGEGTATATLFCDHFSLLLFCFPRGHTPRSFDVYSPLIGACNPMVCAIHASGRHLFARSAEDVSDEFMHGYFDIVLDLSPPSCFGVSERESGWASERASGCASE